MTSQDGWDQPRVAGSGMPVYPPPPQAGPWTGYAYPPTPFPVAPLPPLATWLYRVGAFLVDQLVPGALTVVGLSVWIPSYVRAIQSLTSSPTPPDPATMQASLMGRGYQLLMLLSLVGLAFNVGNRVFRQGRTGQSLGKKLLGIRLLNERTMAPVGAGTALLRELAHYIDGVAMYIGYLWPLWDPKRQTFADKICGTVVVMDVPPRRP